METFSALLALCEGNSPVTAEFPSQRPVTRSFDVFFDLRLNKRLSKPSRRRWFETPSCTLWCHCNVKMAKFLVWQKVTSTNGLNLTVTCSERYRPICFLTNVCHCVYGKSFISVYNAKCVSCDFVTLLRHSETTSVQDDQYLVVIVWTLSCHDDNLRWWQWLPRKRTTYVIFTSKRRCNYVVRFLGTT